MIPDQMPPKATKLELGKTYIIVHNYEPCELFTFKQKSDLVRMDECTYYGPIDTTPSLIDLSHFDLRKIEPKKQPDKPGVWHLSSREDVLDVVQSVTTELLNHPLPWLAGEYRYLCDFIPPRQSPVIPPLPTVTLYAVEQLGVVKWCHKSISGFWTADGLQAFGDPDAVPIAEKVVTVTE